MGGAGENLYLWFGLYLHSQVAVLVNLMTVACYCSSVCCCTYNQFVEYNCAVKLLKTL